MHLIKVLMDRHLTKWYQILWEKIQTFLILHCIKLNSEKVIMMTKYRMINK